MKQPPQPATVHEVDTNGNPVLHTKRSATRVSKETSSSPSSKTRSPQTKNNISSGKNKSSDKTNTKKASSIPGFILGTSKCLGPIEDVVKTYALNRDNPLTIFTRSQDQSRERNEVQGYHFRKVFFTDETEVLNPTAVYDSRRYARLTVFITKGDEEHPAPTIYVEQTVFKAAKETILIHELGFGAKIQVDVEYIFPACGDEDVNLGKRDLRLHFKSLEQDVWNSYMRRVKHYGYDRKDIVFVNQYSLLNGLTYAVPRTNIQQGEGLKISFDPDDLQVLLDAKRKKRSSLGDSRNIELLKMCLHGLGESTEDRNHSGDLDLRLVYKP